LLQSLEENCKGDYVNIDPDNTKCVVDFQAYSEVSNSMIWYCIYTYSYAFGLLGDPVMHINMKLMNYIIVL
jgi:hypothetical protein